ncbi:hypothetical protein [Actinoplanes rectilineatus]|uniref:hypothetical protein n=1 Tax=Actinoplanes rectilineatus TaxID=113571 RepID=UPI0012F9638D|nr:hypothetical protein [Actinoplanes rectilineatus]
MRAEIHISAHRIRFRAVGQPQVQYLVNLGFVLRRCSPQNRSDVAERLGQPSTFRDPHPASRRVLNAT